MKLTRAHRGIRKKTIRIIKSEKISGSAAFGKLLPDSYIALLKGFRESRTKQIERILRRAFAQQHFSLQRAKFPVPLALLIGETAELLIGFGKRAVQIATPQFEPAIRISLLRRCCRRAAAAYQEGAK
jgi:hypothetical protein